MSFLGQRGTICLISTEVASSLSVKTRGIHILPDMSVTANNWSASPAHLLPVRRTTEGFAQVSNLGPLIWGSSPLSAIWSHVPGGEELSAFLTLSQVRPQHCGLTAECLRTELVQLLSCGVENTPVGQADQCRPLFPRSPREQGV